MYAILIVGSLENRIVSSSTIVNIRIVFLALGIPRQNNVCLSMFI
jgi:hypothetical protein